MVFGRGSIPLPGTLPDTLAHLMIGDIMAKISKADALAFEGYLARRGISVQGFNQNLMPGAQQRLIKQFKASKKA